MRYYGKISDDKDLVNKEYSDKKLIGLFVVSDTPPEDHNIFWIDSNTSKWYYCDPDTEIWLEFGGVLS